MTEPPVQPPPLPPMALPIQDTPKPQGLAVASLVLGIISCTGCLNIAFIPSILAIIFGAIAKSRVRAGTGGGRAMAMAGLICGVAGAVLYIGTILLWAVTGYIQHTRYR